MSDTVETAKKRWKGEITVHSPSVISIRFQGTLELDIVGYVDAAVRNASPAKPVYLFFDVLEIEGYTPEARSAMTRWAGENRSRLARWAFLFRSKVVAMRVTIAKLALGGIIDSYTNPRS